MEPLKVEKFSTADRGNGLRALAPLRPGELLFRSDPLAYTVCKGSRGVVCDRCLLGYVRSALAHRSLSARGPRSWGGVCVVGSPPLDSIWPGLPRCSAPHSPHVRLPGARGGWQTPRGRPGAAVPGVGGVPGSALQLCRALLDLLTPAPLGLR